MTPLDQPRRPGLFCGAAHPVDPTILCRLLSGHWPGSLHDDGQGNTWTEENAA